jgi:hypothetical protein
MFQNEPADPMGNGPLDIFTRQLKRWLRQFIIWDIKGAKCIPHPNGGRTFVIPEQTNPPSNSTPPLSHPFKIYQPTNFASFATGITFLDPSSGVGTVCNIAKDDTPTDFTANPPVVNVKESWRFWAVRTGQVEMRPIYSIPGSGGGSFEYTDATGDPNNWGYKFDVDLTDVVSPMGNYQEYDDPTTETNAPPLIMSGTPDPNGFICMSLWIDIVPDTSGDEFPTATIAGTNVTEAPDGALTPFPSSGPNLIPVGIIYPGGNIFGWNTDFFVEQFLFDHVTGRFPPGNGNFGSGGVMNFRGNYALAQDFYQPLDLDQQIFYPGDVVSVYDSDGNGIMYQFVGPSPAFWPTDEFSADNNWANIFSGTTQAF